MTTSRRTFVRGAAALAATTALEGVARASPEVKLRLATLGPNGSHWVRALNLAGRAISEQTNGAVELKVYAGGIMGDEGAMVRKMRTGQLDGVMVTTTGLAEIDQQLAIFGLPRLLKTYDAVDTVRDAMTRKYEALLQAKGFWLAGWTDVGHVRVFSNIPVQVPSDLTATKSWAWQSDVNHKEMMKVCGVSAVPLEAPDVLPSLQTGLIDAFVASPYSAVALQWYTKAAYMTELKLAMGMGGTVLTQKAIDGLSSTHRQVVQGALTGLHAPLRAAIRKANTKAKADLAAKGITSVDVTDKAPWAQMAKQVRQNLTGSVFDKALVDEVLSLL